jgi:acyl-CoA thioesterase
MNDASAGNPACDYCRDHDRFAAANGIELIEAKGGRARARLILEDRHRNSIGTAHGGLLFSLAATAFFAACNTSGRMAVGVNMSITCLKPVAGGTLRAEAEETARSRKLVHGRVRILDESGEPLAIFQGTAYVKEQPYPPESVS